jgi:hypothetical protein
MVSVRWRQNTLPSLRCFRAVRSMCRRATLLARAIGASTKIRVPLKECKPWHVLVGGALIWWMVRDIGYNRNSLRKSATCFCSSCEDKNSCFGCQSLKSRLARTTSDLPATSGCKNGRPTASTACRCCSGASPFASKGDRAQVSDAW